MPRAKHQEEVRKGTYRPHVWSDAAESAIAAKLGTNSAAALKEAANVLGRAVAAQPKFTTLRKRQGGPSNVLIQDTIRHLRRIFADWYVGKTRGRVARENEFIESCLIDARLIEKAKAETPLVETALWHDLRTSRESSALPPPIWRSGPGRQKAMEKIADSFESVREKPKK
jgi:hypothetical protein